jgi:N-glycosidase YbiA
MDASQIFRPIPFIYNKPGGHYYQAQKFADTPAQALMLQIHDVPTPEGAAALGRNACDKMRADWELIKVQVMHEAVLTKFLTHPDIREILLSTGTETIIENSETDSYWGCGADGTGKNQLGEVLMRVRAELRGKVEPVSEF